MYKMLCLASRVNPEQEFLEKKLWLRQIILLKLIKIRRDWEVLIRELYYQLTQSIAELLNSHSFRTFMSDLTMCD